MWKFIKYLLVTVMFVSIITPINNAHLGKAEAAGDFSYVINNYSKVENGSFDKLIFDDIVNGFTLSGTAFYDDFSTYSLGSSPSRWNTTTNSADSYIKIEEESSNQYVHIVKTNIDATRPSMSVGFSPTNQGQAEYRIKVNSGQAFMIVNGDGFTNTLIDNFRITFENNGRITYGTTYGSDPSYYLCDYNLGQEYTIKFMWDFSIKDGIDIYIDNTLVKESAYSDHIKTGVIFNGIRVLGGLVYLSDFNVYQVKFTELGKTTGQYTSSGINVPNINVHGSKISWSETLPSGTSATIKTSISFNGSSWTPYKTATNGQPIPDLPTSGTLTNTKIKYQITLNTTNINITPVVKNLTFNIINNKIPSISLSIPSNNPPLK
ncbi:hypothetical protein V6C27_13910 [Peptococcaceae bacterium 1198_IL3148]